MLGGLCNPFPLFSLFTLIPYFFSFLFFPALRRVDFFEKMALMLNSILNSLFVVRMSRKRVSPRNPFSVGYSTDLKIR
ncbi:hypothetical protein C789_4079 [Microcystis aeruginosa FACHB-905 = DIANCHI905]|nr:hypothetical protein C789_4079 [Microcystis aeruginosa FACHB-905 = DIANCHI905]